MEGIFGPLAGAVLDCSLRAGLDAGATFCAVFDACCYGFAVDEFVYVYWAYVYAFGVAGAFVVVDFYGYVS